MADVKDQVVEETTEVTETTTNEQTEPRVYGFTQDQVDEVVAKRLARERDAVAKKLGVDKYDDIDSFLESVNSIKSEKEQFVSELGQIKETLLEKEFRLHALSVGIKPEHVDRAVKLARTEISDEVDMEKAFGLVLDDFPMLKGGDQPVRKIGAETVSEGQSKTDMDRYLDKYKNSKYYSK